jgi:hypothetical protein
MRIAECGIRGRSQNIGKILGRMAINKRRPMEKQWNDRRIHSAIRVPDFSVPDFSLAP